MEMRRSKVKLSARPQMAAHASTLTQGTPSLVRRRRICGAWPSSAIAKGTRVMLIMSGLNMPTPLIMPPATTAMASMRTSENVRCIGPRTGRELAGSEAGEGYGEQREDVGEGD